MKTFLFYLFSKNRKTYAKIANQHKSSALRVYALAHGKRARSNRDYDIIQSLVDSGIVSGYKTI